MNTTQGLKIQTTLSVLRKIIARNYAPKMIMEVFSSPEKIEPSLERPGQFKIFGQGICLVGAQHNDNFVLITVYST